MADYTQPDVVSRRVRFFDGQYLTDQDFVDEQKYHLDRERRVLNALRVTGVVDGLTVTTSGMEVGVAPGTAVDDLGRLVVLTAPVRLTVSGAAFTTAPAEVRLVYRQAETDLADRGGSSGRRWDETPAVAVVATDGSVLLAPDDAPREWDGPSVLLAQVTATTDATLAVGAAGPRVGMRLPGPVTAGGDLFAAGVVHLDRVDRVGGYGTNRQKLRAEGDGVHLRWGPVASTTDDHSDLYLKNLFADGVLSAKGNASVGGSLTCKDSVYADKNVFATGSVVARGEVAATGVLSTKDALVVGKDASVTGGATVSGGLGVKGAASVGGALDVTGHVGVGGPARNDHDWGRVLDLRSGKVAALRVRSAVTDTDPVGVDGFLLTSGAKVYNAPAGMAVGTATSHAVSLMTNGSSRLVVTADGDVGVNRDLTVLSDLVVDGTVRANSEVEVTGGVSAGGDVGAGRDAVVERAVRLHDPSYGDQRQVLYASERGLELRFGDADTPAENPLSQLFLNNIFYSGKSASNSDERLKTDVVDVDGALDRVCRLRGVTYSWNDTAREVLSLGDAVPARQIGVLAQDVEAVLPELVHVGPDGYRCVDYPKLAAVLVAAVKEQQALVEGLRSRVAAVEGATAVGAGAGHRA